MLNPSLSLSWLPIKLIPKLIHHIPGDHLVLAVLKQKGTEARTVAFSDNQELVEVEPPAAKAHLYKLRDEFSDSEAKQYPLFDSADRVSISYQSSPV